MKKSVTLSRALKEKNRWAGKLALLRSQIGYQNSMGEDTQRDIDVEAVLAEATCAEQILVDIKTAIAEANKEIVGTIVALEETKCEIAWLNGLDTTAFCRKNSYGGVDRRTAVISGAQKIKLVKERQLKANALQDKLDEFNSSHRVFIEVEE